MVLHIDSDAAYLVLSDLKIDIAGFYHLFNKGPTSPAIPNVPIHSPILIVFKRIKRVIASSAKMKQDDYL